jgi:putative transcriptional regulator
VPVESLRGHLLIANPTLADPNFARTVVLVGEHGEEGAMGVILNRRSPATVAAAVPELSGPWDSEESLFLGGPVRPSVVLVLAEFVDAEAAGMLVTERIGFLSAEAEIEELAQLTARARVFAGYAGWGPGQLEAEVENTDWLLAPALEDDVFNEDPDGLWTAVLERMGMRYALLARMPPDPSVN